jgi:hypothetical protein
MISEAESLNVCKGHDFYIVESRSGLNNEIVEKFNLIKNKEIFNYSSKNVKLISDEELLKQIS